MEVKNSMVRREIRPNRARVVGNILPTYAELMKTHNYEVFNCKQEENGGATFRSIHSTTRNLYSLNRGKYYISNLENWICEKARSGTGITGANLKKVSLVDGGVDIGRGYLTIYKTPVIYDITNELNPESFIYTVELSYDSDYAYTLLGFINAAGNNVSPGISKKLNNLVSFSKKDAETHTLEFKGKEGIVYLFLDGLYTGQYLDITGQTRDLMCAFYMGSASTSYKGIIVNDIHMQPMSSIYPATYLTTNADVWVTDKIKNGTSVPEDKRVAPYINTDTGRMNAGRGYCVYLKKGVINPYNQELYETGFTLSCDVYWDEGTGQEVLFGELNTEGTDVTGAFKKSLADICDAEDVTDKLNLKWKCKNGGGYLFVNDKYTGVHREMSSVNYMLGMYNSKDLDAANVDGVELYNVTIDNKVNLYPFTYQFLNLKNWEYKQYSGSSSTTLKEPSLTDDGERVDIGGSHYAYLNAPLMIYDNTDYKIVLSFTGNYQRIGLGRITFVNDKIRPTGIDRALYELTADINNPHTITYKVLNQIAYLFLDNKYTGIKYDFTEEIYNIFMGFYDNNVNDGIKIHNIEAVRGTITEPPRVTYFPLGVLGNWVYFTVSGWTGTPEDDTWDSNGLTLGRYKRNIYKVPFHRSAEYEIKFKNAGSFYIGLSDSYTRPKKYQSVRVIQSNGFSNGPNTVLIKFDGEDILLTPNGGTTHKLNIPAYYADNVYFMELQDNNNDAMVITEIKETLLTSKYSYNDFTFEDNGSGDGTSHLSMTSTGAIMGYGGIYYYNTLLSNQRTYEIHFKYGEEYGVGLMDEKSSETANLMTEYVLQSEFLHENEENVLLIKLNGGRITYNLNNEDTYVESGLPADYTGLYLYTYSNNNSVPSMVITDIKEYKGGT